MHLAPFLHLLGSKVITLRILYYIQGHLLHLRPQRRAKSCEERCQFFICMFWIKQTF